MSAHTTRWIAIARAGDWGDPDFIAQHATPCDLLICRKGHARISANLARRLGFGPDEAGRTRAGKCRECGSVKS